MIKNTIQVLCRLARDGRSVTSESASDLNLRLDEILGDPDVAFAVDADSHAHLFEGSTHEIIIVISSWPLVDHHLLNLLDVIRVVAIATIVADVLAPGGPVYPFTGDTCARSGFARTLVLQTAATRHEVAVGTCALGEDGVPAQSGSAQDSPVMVDQREQLLFERRDMILWLKRFDCHVFGWESQR